MNHRSQRRLSLAMDPEKYKSIISDAINREVEAYTFYQTVSDKVKDANLKKLFGELAGEEKGHREYLQKLLSRDITSLGFSATKDYKVGDSIPTPVSYTHLTLPTNREV